MDIWAPFAVFVLLYAPDMEWSGFDNGLLGLENAQNCLS